VHSFNKPRQVFIDQDMMQHGKVTLGCYQLGAIQPDSVETVMLHSDGSGLRSDREHIARQDE